MQLNKIEQSLTLFGILLACGLSLANAQYFHPGRPQRSLFSSGPSGWNSGWNLSPPPSFELHSRPNHITKDEVLALLAAWKAEAKPKPTPPTGIGAVYMADN